MKKNRKIWDVMVCAGLFGIPIVSGGDPLTLGFWVGEVLCFASLIVGALKGGYIYVD